VGPTLITGILKGGRTVLGHGKREKGDGGSRVREMPCWRPWRWKKVATG